MEAGGENFCLLLVELVDLVEDQKLILLAQAQLAEDAVDGLHLLLEIFIGHVNHLEQQIALLKLLEGGLEGIDELLGQIVNEAYGVGDDQLRAIGKVDGAGGGPQRGEELVLGLRFLAGQEAVEERGLAGVGVADDADHRDLVLDASAAAQLALLAKLLDILLQLADAVAGRGGD